MDREPPTPADDAVDALADPAAADTPAAEGRVRPLVDVSGALHEAGHELVDLGWEDLPDSGPVLHTEEGHTSPDDPLDFVNVQIPSD